MKIINNEFEYKNWMIKEFLHIEDDLYCILSPEELEAELLNQMPEQFPCIALLVAAENHNEMATIRFLYRDQIEEWAAAMGLATHR